MDLGVTTEKVPGGWLVEVSGEVDLHTAPSLRAALDAAVAEASEADSGAVLVDLTGVSFMDSTGLGELVGAYKALDKAGKRLHLTRGPDRVAKLLTLTGLDQVLTVHATLPEALASLAQGA